MFTRHSTGNKLITLAAIVMAIMVASCSSVRHVPADKYLLDKATVTISDETPDVKANSLHNYLRQVPNHKVLGFAKLQLGVYNMSGQDSTKWYNKWVRRLGEEPKKSRSNSGDYASVARITLSRSPTTEHHLTRPLYCKK